MSTDSVSAFAVYKRTTKTGGVTKTKKKWRNTKFDKKISVEKKVTRKRKLVKTPEEPKEKPREKPSPKVSPKQVHHSPSPVLKSSTRDLKSKEKKTRKNSITKTFTQNDNLKASLKVNNGTEKGDEDTSSQALELFKWLIAPTTPEMFLDKFWEQQPIHLKRNQSKYYHHIFGTEHFDRILRDNPLHYGRNIDVVSYENGVKQVFNQEGRAVAAALWDYYSNGCSIRLLNPHTYSHKVHLLLSTLQEYFGTMVGANVYLTPSGSQGFAPHFDDIEAFIVQLEGRKHWKLYRPNTEDFLTRESSGNFDRAQIGEPFMNVTLEEGDLLYFPRGIIHEGRTDEDAHSLHMTISVYQRTAYVDLLEKILPEALKSATRDDLEFRKGLPLNYLKHVGAVNSIKNSTIKQSMKETVNKLLNSLVNYVDVDAAADQLGRKFMYDSLPPLLSRSESERTAKSDGDRMRNGSIYNKTEFRLDTNIRLVRYHCLRLICAEGTAPKLYYNTENATVYHGEEEQSLELQEDMIDCITILQNSYPSFIEIEALPLNDDSIKIQLISDLWERGLIVTKEPLHLLK